MKRLVFLGDSITDCYHSFDPENLGEGYVRFIHEELTRNSSDIHVINKGFDGFTMMALKRLWKQQGIELRPDILTILIGINDIGVIHNTGTDAAFALKEFQLSYKTLLNYIRGVFSGPIILMEPFLFPVPEKYLLWFEDLKEMNRLIEDISSEYDLIHIPLWDTLLHEAKTSGYDMITTDGIHLTEKGHKIISDKWLKIFKTWFCT